MGWAEAIKELILGLLRAVPIIDRWFRKTPLQKEQEAKVEVDKEHSDNAESRRPSGDFWKDRGV